MTPHPSLPALQSYASQIAAALAPKLPPLTVHLSTRLTRSAGTYRPPDTITVSRHFLDQHGLDAACAVVRHEVAHHAVRWTVAGRARPHGREFQAIAAALGAPRHAPAFAAPRLVHGYRCTACGWTSLRGRRLGRALRYSCARCAPRYDDRYRLTYVGSWRTTA